MLQNHCILTLATWGFVVHASSLKGWLTPLFFDLLLTKTCFNTICVFPNWNARHVRTVHTDLSSADYIWLGSARDTVCVNSVWFLPLSQPLAQAECDCPFSFCCGFCFVCPVIREAGHLPMVQPALATCWFARAIKDGVLDLSPCVQGLTVGCSVPC